MTETAQATPPISAPELRELPIPSPLAAVPPLSGPRLTPQQILHFYSPEAWEEFILEWASAIKELYVETKDLGGSNDHGVDVAAFKTHSGFEGAWDCYQGKHYADPLKPSDAWPEILKIFRGVLAGHYQMPDAYYFVAPQGCGMTLDRLISTPTKFQQSFLEELDKDKGCAAALQLAELQQVRDLAGKTDFSLFRSMKLLDALDLHRKTQYYVARFGGPMPGRPPIAPPPEDVAPIEKRYVTQLVKVYEEQSPGEQLKQGALAIHPTHGDHFKRQRISFYSAEALRLHARDSVPDGTFEALQNDMHSGVVEVAEAPNTSGMARLREVLNAATQVQLDRHAALMSVSSPDDRKGICHQLANEDRLTWVKGQPS